MFNSFKIALRNTHLKFSEFQEYANNLEDRYVYVNLENITAMLSISIRGSNNAHILLCNGTNYNRDLCYWIIIGGWDNTLSVIRKCATGVPVAGKFPELNSDCSKAQVSFKVKYNTITLSLKAIFSYLDN